jgi:hypothetical protein
MQRLTRDQFLQLTGLTSSRFDVMQHDGHVALAFGVPIPAVAGQYFDMDVVAVRLTGELTPVVGRDVATAVILSHFDIWGDTVGRADFDARPMFFAVGIIEKKGTVIDAKGVRPREFLVTGGTQQEIVDDFALSHQDKVVVVNVTRIIEHIRETARAAGWDLSAPFFLHPQHKDYAATLAEAKSARGAALARLKRDRKKYARSKAPGPNTKSVYSRESVIGRLADAPGGKTPDVGTPGRPSS